MDKENLDILLLCDYQAFSAATIVDHINAIYYYSRHNIYVYANIVNNQGNLPDDIELNKFDCIIIHYSLALAIDAYVSPFAKLRLKNFQGLKVVFIQDEYRFVDRTIRILSELGFHILFTCVPENEIEKVYPIVRMPNVSKYNVLTGYIPFQLTTEQTVPLYMRKYDVGYRGRKYPFWHGRLGLEKWQIAEKFKKQSKKYGLRTNISYREKDRIYGVDWISFLKNCKAVLGVESGASIFDFTGKISASVEVYTELLKRRKNKDGISYDDVKNKFFLDLEDKISLEQISPRCFEAISVKTLLILYEGNYSGILKPWKHYVPLKKDHSNFEQVVEILKNDKKIADIVSNAFSEIANNDKYSYRNFVKWIDELFIEEIKEEMLHKKKAYNKNEFYKKWPFYFVSYPHGLTRSKKDKTLLYFKSITPHRISRYIKSIINISR